MAVNKTSIVSQAVQIMGHKPIQTLDQADDMVIAAEQAYDMLLPAVLSAGNWRFATQIAQLSKSVETPPPNTYWTSIYLLPAGYLKNTRIWPQNFDYEIYENNRLYTNWGGQAMYMEYMFVPDVSRLTPLFINYFVYEIAALLALSTAQKPEYYQVIEAKRIQMWALAAAADAQNRPNFSQVNFPVLGQRDIGGLIGNAIS